MPVVSKKGMKMPQSPIRKLVPYAEDAKKRGTKVYHLNIGQPDIKTPEVALEAIKNNDLKVLEYSRSEGSEIYREKIAAYYEKQHIHVNAKEIIVTTGGSEALLFTMGSIADTDDEIIIPEPFYANYNGFATAAGVNIVPVISKIEDNFALPPIAEFEKLITPKTKAILICNPGNPTGYLYSEEEILKLAEIVKRHDLFLIADEVYREFTYDGEEHYSIMQVNGLEDHAIIIDSVSKRYSMCGARIGCLVSKNQEVIAAALKFAQARLSPPTFAQIASEAALDTPQSYFNKVITEYVSRRNTLISELEKIDQVKVARPKGAFYCIAELPVKNADDFAQWLLEKFQLNNETIMVAPAAGFYSTQGIGVNQIRIAYVLKEEDLIKAAAILKAALKEYNFGIDVNARFFVEISSEKVLNNVLLTQKEHKKFIIGGGSNMLLTKDIDALVLYINNKGKELVYEDDTTVQIKVAAGENWHNFILWCLENNYGGLENLSLIPGNVGTAPIQNIGAYGVELKDLFVSCEALHIQTLTKRTFSIAECEFGYRDSIFKNEVKGQYIITNVTFKLTKANHILNTSYGAIAASLKEKNINQPTIKDISNAVITIRKTKLPDPAEIGNSGSFFKNPVISKSDYQKLQLTYPTIPGYQLENDKTKVPAGWLIEQCQFKGKRYGNTGIHKNQALVLVNYGNANGKEVMDLAEKIQKTVIQKFGIAIETEVNIIK